MAVLWSLYGAALVMAFAEVFGTFRHLMCDCYEPRRRHFTSFWQFVNALLSLGVGVCALVVIGPPTGVVWLVVSAFCFYFWWKHTKNKRKKLKEKVLGRVKVTLAGLKVVPVPVGAAALVVALSACGASPETAEKSVPESNSDVIQITQKVTYEDGVTRTVQCLLYNRVREAGLSCDWARAK